MRTFTIIWLGQLVSTIGTYMTEFALTLWAWEVTGSATALALIVFFGQLSRIPVTLFAGLLVDRANRKHIMMLGDSTAAVSTIAIGLLYFTETLQIWHLYLAAILNGGFGQIQRLAYQTSVPLIVSRQHYTRASSMDSAVHYGSAIIGPALAGMLYPLIGVPGIVGIDLATFGIAIATLLTVTIPQPQVQSGDPLEPLLARLTFGFREVWRQPSLKLLLLINLSFWFFHDLGGAVYDPMILARSNGSAQVLASTASAAGLGGVTGAIVLSVWGGPKRRISGMLAGFIGAGLSKTLFGLGRSLQVWVPAQFCSSLNFPLLGSSETAIWMEKIATERQGRVFAANALATQLVSAIASLLAGPLAERVFEPALRSGSNVSVLFSPIFGIDTGAGTSLLYVLCSGAMVLTGIIGFCLPRLRKIEELPIAVNQD